jgi:uracil-DNA glycosylase
MGYPTSCNICFEHKAELGIGGLELSVKPFKQGENPTVMLVGLNPTLTKKKAHTVFELDNKKSPIYSYIVNDVLQPSGISLNDIYATNLIKCTFRDEPRIIAGNVSGDRDNKAVKEFLAPFFNYCKGYFVAELQEVKPRLVISFGEVPHQFIVNELDLTKHNVKPKMKDAFADIYQINACGRDFYYAPCIRVVAKRHPIFQEAWEPFILRIRDIANSAPKVE